MTLSLKSQNRPLLIIFSLAIGAGLWWLIEPYSMDKLADLDKIYQSAVFVGLATIFTLLVGELVPSRLKLLLVYWKWVNPTPSSRAFTDLMQKDFRIDPSSLEEKYGPLPTDPAEQARKFFSIYKPLDGEISIDDAHKSYLLFRELCAISVVFAIFGTAVAFIWTREFLPPLVFFLISSVMYTVCAIAGQNAGKRFVANVLAVASSTG